MSPWDTPGIAPDSDTRMIRSAYAATLKTIDVESDPAAFVRLREAFDLVRDHAERATCCPPAPVLATASPLAERAEGADGALVHAAALAVLLYPPGEARPWLDPEEEQRALELWHHISQDPRIADIGKFAEFERWASDLIGNALPRSAPLVEPAIALFRWTATDGHVGQSHVLAEINRHHRLHRFLKDIREPSNRYHAAWTELNLPAPGGARRGGVEARLIYDVLAVVRQARPGIETALDPKRVAMWDDHLRGIDLAAREEAAAATRFEKYRSPVRLTLYALFLVPLILHLLAAILGTFTSSAQ